MEKTLPQNDVPFCANIFFRLLCEAMNNKRRNTENYNKSKKPTQTHLFYDLNMLTESSHKSLGNYDYLFSGDKLQGGQKNVASEFNQGKIEKCKRSTIYLLNDAKIKCAFDYQVTNEYSAAFEKIVEFAQRYFDNKDSERNTVLIKKVLFLIFNDTSISESQEFYICSDGSTKTKSELRNIDNVEFEAFLLGVWHYLIVSQRLQVGLQGIKDIIIDIGYKEIETSITYSSIKQDSDKKNKINNRYRKPSRCLRTRENGYVNEMSEEEIKYERAACISEIEEYMYNNTNIIEILEEKGIVLSRNIFFHILSEYIACGKRKNAVEKLFLSLINLIDYNDCYYSFNKKYADSCSDSFLDLKKLYSFNFLDEKKCYTDFTERLRNNHADVLSDMINIRKKYFRSTEYNKAIVVSLIEFIRNDKTIDDSYHFFVGTNFSALTKSQLCEIEEIEFEPFLICIWHFVVSRLNKKDCKGEETFNEVFQYKTHIRSINEDYIGYHSIDLIKQQSKMEVKLIYLEMVE